MDEAIASYINPEDPKYGLRLQFTSEENCTDSQMYGFTLDVRCDEDVKTPIPRIVSDSVSSNTCNPRVYLDSEAGKSIW